MYLGIDVGGTKTLLAVFDENRRILKQHRFPTPQKYQDFLVKLQEALQEFKNYQIKACCCAIPGKVDRKKGLAIHLGNLTWQKVPIKNDLELMLGHIQVYVENDANLAGLYEASLYHNQYNKVLYLTIGTGIGIGIIINSKIDPEFADSEVGNTVIEHDGKLRRWEDFSSGRALKSRYGKLASEIDDPKIWSEYVDSLIVGFDAALAAFQPEIVIVGGGVGAHFNKFGHLLVKRLKELDNKMVPIPPIVQAKRPEEAVIYGCYAFIRQQLGKRWL